MALVHGVKPIVTSGLVLCLDAGNRKSYPTTGTAWTDLSGRGNTGTLFNAPTYGSSNGGSLGFDGVNEYVDCGSSGVLSIPNSLAISVWIKFPTGYGNATWNSILAKRPSGGSANYAMNYNPQVNLFQWFYLGNGGGILSVPLTSNFSTNTWTNVCGVFSQNSTTTDAFLYKNGSLLTSINLTGNVPSISGKFTIGCYGDSSFIEFSPITIAQVSIYNRALTATEITQNYNALKSRYI
jgi:hypothetical protein